MLPIPGTETITKDSIAGLVLNAAATQGTHVNKSAPSSGGSSTLGGLAGAAGGLAGATPYGAALGAVAGALQGGPSSTATSGLNVGDTDQRQSFGGFAFKGGTASGGTSVPTWAWIAAAVAAGVLALLALRKRG